MENKRTIKQMYNLDYDNSGVNSGLIKWYNQLLDKSVDELTEVDISKMIRQEILKELAIDKAIEVFQENPIAGEMYDGDILDMLNSLAKKQQLSLSQLEKIKKITNDLREQSLEHEWGDEEEKKVFIENLSEFN